MAPFLHFLQFKVGFFFVICDLGKEPELKPYKSYSLVLGMDMVQFNPIP